MKPVLLDLFCGAGGCTKGDTARRMTVFATEQKDLMKGGAFKANPSSRVITECSQGATRYTARSSELPRCSASSPRSSSPVLRTPSPSCSSSPLPASSSRPSTRKESA